MKAREGAGKDRSKWSICTDRQSLSFRNNARNMLQQVYCEYFVLSFKTSKDIETDSRIEIAGFKTHPIKTLPKAVQAPTP